MIRSTIQSKAHLALAVLVALALSNMALGHHMLSKMNVVSQAVVESGELYRLTKRILTTVTNPRSDDPEIQASLFGPLDGQVASWIVPDRPASGLAEEHSQLALLWLDMAGEWQRVRASYDAVRRDQEGLMPQALAELTSRASELEASIGAVQYLAARELESVYGRLRYSAIAIGLVDLLVIGVLVVGLRKQVLNPLSALARAAREYSGEGYDHQFASRERNEIGDLARALDRAARRVRAMLATVRNSASMRAQAEEKFRSLVEHAGVGVFLMQGGRYVYVNSRFAEMFATTPAEVYADFVVGDHVDARDRERAGDLIDACLRGDQRTIHFECCALREDGRIIDCEIFGTRTEYGGEAAIIGTIVDHTERRRADAQLRTLSRAIEQSRATVLVTDTAGRIEYVNPHFLELTGYSADEVMGRTPAILKSGYTDPAVYRTLWECVTCGLEWSGELLNRKKSGELFWEHMVASAVRDEQGEITHFVAVKEDISARKHAERELERLNRTLRVLSESNQTLVHATDESELLRSTCRNLVLIGGYRLALVGEPVDDEAREVRITAQHGADQGFAESIADSDRGAGPSGRAIRSGQSIVVRDVERDPSYQSFRAEAQRREFRSTIALPLRSGGRVFGVLRIYSGEANAFSADEVKLLTDLADDLAYGMASLRTRAERERAERALRESEQRFRSISACAHDAIVIVDRGGRVTFWNAAAERMTGYAEEQVVGRVGFAELVVAEDAGPLQAAIDALSRVGDAPFEGATVEFRALRSNGSPISVEAATSVVQLDGDWQLLVLARDISARKAAEEALNIRNRAIESSSNAIIIARSRKADDNPVIYVNPAFERITGFRRDEAIGRNPRFLIGEDWGQTGIERLREALRHHISTQVLLRNYRRDGSVFWAEVSVSPVVDDGGTLTHYISVITDVTERVRFEEELRHQATHDQLTGLANRVLLADRIDQAVAHASRSGHYVAVLLLDLDRFKFINESLGHGAGDEVVRTVGDRLRTCVRRGDTVARIGGDEFVVVLAELAATTDAALIAHKIQESVGLPIDLQSQQLFVTVSIGIGLAPADGSEAESLLRNADVAMYAAKDQGGSCFRFYLDGMNDRARRQLSLEADLRRAVERDELQLHYQPKLDIRQGRIVGAEALIRWNHPLKGMIPPLDFIPLAEETGLIVAIGEWALRKACEDASRWQARDGVPVTVAVNISARQFRHGGLAQAVRAALADASLPPECLELELTESVIMQNEQTTIAALDDLKAIGINLSIDDFGTGYSSLSYLRDFPVDTLKIDRSFVKDLAASEDCQTVAGAVLVLAHGLGMNVVAEGVETIEQLSFLRERGCDQIQGYLFSRPLPEPEFRAMYARSLDGDASLAAKLGVVAAELMRSE